MSSLQSVSSLCPGTMFRLPSDLYMRIENDFAKGNKVYAVNLDSGRVIELGASVMVITLDNEGNENAELDGEDDEGGKA